MTYILRPANILLNVDDSLTPNIIKTEQKLNKIITLSDNINKTSKH